MDLAPSRGNAHTQVIINGHPRYMWDTFYIWSWNHDLLGALAPFQLPYKGAHQLSSYLFPKPTPSL